MTMSKHFSKTFLWIFLFVQTTFLFAQEKFGVIDDSYQVNQTGSYNHIIPIHVAPGINGQTPNIALVYDSKSGLGELGYGWTISGLSKITRGGNNLAQHGRVDGINLNKQDALLLDGQILQVVQGDYYNPGSKYKTENETNALIIASNTMQENNSNSPKSFEVKQPNGMTYYYGSRIGDDSKLILQTNDLKEVMAWHLDKIVDPFGNTIEFYYSAPDNVIQIESIRYTGNSKLSLEPKCIVYFRYMNEAENKRKSNTLYFKGNTIQDKRVLKSIEIETDAKIFKRYYFEYDQDQKYLLSIKECDNKNECLPKTIFEYGNTSEFKFSKSKTVNFPHSPISLNSAFDKEEYIQRSFAHARTGGQDNDIIYDENGIPRLVSANEKKTTQSIPKMVKYSKVDFNNDGHDDLLVLTAVKTSNSDYKIVGSIYFNENNQFKKLNGWENFTISEGKGIRRYQDIDLSKILIEDFDGNGLIDIISDDFIYFNTSNVKGIHFYKKPMNNKQLEQDFSNVQTFLTGDLNGNRKSEIIIFSGKDGKYNLDIYFLSDNKLSQINTNDFKNKNFELIGLYDIHGTGKKYVILKEGADLIVINVDHNNKATFNKISLPNDIRDKKISNWRFIDINLDGYLDILCVEENKNPFFYLFNGNELVNRNEIKKVFKRKDGVDYLIQNFTSDDNIQVLLIDKKRNPNNTIIPNEYTYKLYDLYVQNGKVDFARSNIKFKIPNDINLYRILKDEKKDLSYHEIKGGKTDDIGVRVINIIGYQRQNSLSVYDYFLDGSFSIVINNPGRGLNPQGGYEVYKHQYTGNNKLVKITDGFNNIVKVHYSGIKDQSTYNNSKETLEKEYFRYSGSYPIVKQIEYSNGVSKTSLNKTNYQYEDLIYEANGRGISGFKKVSKTEVDFETKEEKLYEYQFPLSGKLKKHSIINTTNNVITFEQQNTWDYQLRKINQDGILMITNNSLVLNTIGFSLRNLTYTPILFNTNVTKRELNNDIVSKSSISYKYDDFGFITESITTFDDETKLITKKILKNIDYTGGISPLFMGLPTFEKTFLVSGKGDTSDIRTMHYDYYEDNGRVKLSTRQKGDSVLEQNKSFEYDEAGNLIKQSIYKNLNNQITDVFDYGKSKRFLISHINPLGFKTTYETEPNFGNNVLTTDANGLKTYYKYDSFGTLESISYPDNTNITYQFEFLSSIEDKFHGSKTEALYKLTTKQSGSENIITYYDQLGREVSKSYSLIDTKYYPEFHDFIPNPSGGIPLVRDPRAYDIDGIKRRVFTHQKYNSKGQIVTSYQPAYIQILSGTLIGNKPGCVLVEGGKIYASTIKYDAFGRTIENKLADGNVAKSHYQANSSTYTDFKGNSIRHFYNKKSELIKVTDVNGISIDYSYDLYGNLTKITTPGNQEIITFYDAIGRKTKLIDSNLGTIVYEYDEFDRLIKEVTNETKIIEINYDKLGRVIGKITPEGVITWKYDSQRKGMLDTIIDTRKNLTTFDYDNLGRITKETQCVNKECYSNLYTYDQFSRLQTKTYPSGFKIGYEYSNNIPVMLFELLPNGTKKDIVKISDMNESGLIENKVFGNGIRTKYSYNPINKTLSKLESFKDPNYKFKPDLLQCPFQFNIKPEDVFIREFPREPIFPRPIDFIGSWRDIDIPDRLNNDLFSFNQFKEKSTTNPSYTSHIQDLNYSYDENYNIKQISNLASNKSELYEYDRLNRLTEHSIYKGLSPEKTITYIYQNNGNIASKSDLGMYQYDNVAKNRLVGTVGLQNSYYQYDRYGNIVSDTINGLFVSYTSFNKPEIIEKRTVGKKTLEYGFDNRELASQYFTGQNFEKLSEKTIKPYSDFEIVYNVETKVIDTIHYIGFNGDLVMIYKKGSNNTSSRSYVHLDHLGSIHLLTNNSGSIVAEYSYSPFGERTAHTNSSTSKGFTSHEHLDNFGLINMKGRYYLPSVGRFMSSDPFIQSPINLQSLNRYSYVMNNPINYSDPSGYITIRGNWSPTRAVGNAVNNIGREVGRGLGNVYNEGDRFLDKHGKQVVIIAAAAAITYFSCGTIPPEFSYSILKGAAVGASMSAGMTAYYGGDFNDILRASYNGAINGAASGAMGYGLTSGANKVFGGNMYNNVIIGGIKGTISSGGQEDGVYKGMVASFIPANLGIGNFTEANSHWNMVGNFATSSISSMIQGYIINGEKGMREQLAGNIANFAFGHMVAAVRTEGKLPSYYKNGAAIYENFGNEGRSNSIGGAIVLYDNNDLKHEMKHFSQQNILGLYYLPAHGLSNILGNDFMEKGDYLNNDNMYK